MSTATAAALVERVEADGALFGRERKAEDVAEEVVGLFGVGGGVADDAFEGEVDCHFQQSDRALRGRFRFG